MECWPLLSKHNSWLYWWLMMMMTHNFLVVSQIRGGCIEEERKALLEIKASLIMAFDTQMDHFLPTWVDYECCDWERVKCNTSTGHMTELSLYNLRGVNILEIEPQLKYDRSKLWLLNVSLFRHFRELINLDLSYNFLDKEIMKTGLERLSSLHKLETFNLNRNFDIDNDILPSLGTLTSLKNLDLSYTSLNRYFPTNEFAALQNLEMLDLSHCNINGFESQGSERDSIMRKLKTLNLGSNRYNESVMASLNTLSSLTNLDLSNNPFSGPFPAQELAYLTNVKNLDLSFTGLNRTPSIQDCKSLSNLTKLEDITLSYNNFSKSIISCLSALPSLKSLELIHSFPSGSSFPVQEFTNLPDLEVLDLSHNHFIGTLPIEAFASYHHLEVLDLTYNNFFGSIPSTIEALSSLRAVSFSYNDLNGSLPDLGFCEMKNLHELILSHNMLEGTLPKCFNNLSYLRLLDISSNQFTGILAPSLISNLASLEYIDLSHNKFEGSFSFSLFSNHTKLQAIQFRSDNDKFMVETEEPIDWIPMFQLEVLALSNCNLKMPKGRVVPGFLLHQIKLRELDMSHNSLEGQFPDWLIKNNPNLEFLNLRNNSFGGIRMHRNTIMRGFDMSGNHMMGAIPDNIPKFFPSITRLNLSMNALSGAIPSSLGDFSKLLTLDLSSNDLSGEVPKGLFTNISGWGILKLSKNRLHGQVLSGNFSWGMIRNIHLDNNHFTGKIEIMSKENVKYMTVLDISNNFFTGIIPGWISNLSYLSQLVVRNNSFEGRFPCGGAPFTFLDISHNFFSGPIPSCLNLQYTNHLHLGSNRFTGLIPGLFRDLTNVLTLDIGNNNLSGRIPKFLGQLTNLRILSLRKNNFIGSIPKELCQLSNLSLIDLSDNSLSGSIPNCLQNITGPSYIAFTQKRGSWFYQYPSYVYESVLGWRYETEFINEALDIQDEVQFTSKNLFLLYKGNILDYMAGLDLSCNKLTGEIPELGLLTHIRALNLSHNQLTGPIPVNFSNFAKIESLDLSSNGLTGKVPSELIKLTSLSFFDVSHNNLSGRLPEMKAQFGTFTEESYEGNPLLCGPPLVNKCMTSSQVTNSQVTNPSVEEDSEKWYDIDITFFYGSYISTGVVFLLGFVAYFYTYPQWRKMWLDQVEDCMFTTYYFFYDSVSKLFMPFNK